MNEKLEQAVHEAANETLYYWADVTPVELLGFAKNDIIEALNRLNKQISHKRLHRLREALLLLDDVQNYLLNR